MKLKIAVTICSFLVCMLHAESSQQKKKAIVIGASSGMGRQIALLLGKEGYEVGLVARRRELLETLAQEMKDSTTYIEQIDVIQPEARDKFADLIERMGALDLVVISISAYLDNRNEKTEEWSHEKNWEHSFRTLMVDAAGFIAMADLACQVFKKQGYGHLVGISSTSGLYGFAYSPVYSAAKACISTYMQGVRNDMIQNNISVSVTDVVPGYVAVEHSPMGEDPNAYWEISVEQAGQEIMAAIHSKKKRVFVPWKYNFVNVATSILPDFVLNKYFTWL